MLKVTGDPAQLLALGVILIVAFPVTGVKTGIAVTPVLSESPMAAPPVISKTTPDGVPVKKIALVFIPLQ